MDTKYLKTVLLRFFSILVALGIVFYALWHITNGFSAGVKTVTAVYASKEERLLVRAYIIRSETLVTSRYGGTINYRTAAGEKVGVGAPVADIYESSSGSDVSAQLIDLDERIALLTDAGFSGTVISDTSGCDEKINSLLLSMRADVDSGRYDYALSKKSELLTELYRRSLIVETKTDYNEKIAELSARRAVLASSLHGNYETVTASAAGYFYPDIDGYESVFSSADVADMTVAEFDALTAVPAAGAGSGYAIGKLVTSPTWYAAMKTDRRLLSTYTEGESYAVAFPSSSGVSVFMTLERAVADGDFALLIFSTKTMPTGFSYTRSQSVELIDAAYYGFRLPSSAVRLVEGHTGVYILFGNTVLFRAADIIGETDGYAYISDESESVTLTGTAGADGEGTVCRGLALYDSVIVAGTDLYHGKILD